MPGTALAAGWNGSLAMHQCELDLVGKDGRRSVGGCLWSGALEMRAGASEVGPRQH